MDFQLSKELEMLRKAVREFADQEIAPNADQWDQERLFPLRRRPSNPWANWAFFGTVIPEEYEG